MPGIRFPNFSTWVRCPGGSWHRGLQPLSSIIRIIRIASWFHPALATFVLFCLRCKSLRYCSRPLSSLVARKTNLTTFGPVFALGLRSNAQQNSGECYLNQGNRSPFVARGGYQISYAGSTSLPPEMTQTKIAPASAGASVLQLLLMTFGGTRVSDAAHQPYQTWRHPCESNGQNSALPSDEDFESLSNFKGLGSQPL
jgi:hypothetical protein